MSGFVLPKQNRHLPVFRLWRLILSCQILPRNREQVVESWETGTNSVEEAIRQALNQLGVSREEVKVIILKEGRHSVLVGVVSRG